jgi:transcriptional regulator with XRE-family HTH domain
MPMTNEDSFGSRLSAARKAAALTQEELGIIAGVGKGAVSSWEVGRTEPTLEQLALIADKLAVTADFLLRGCANDQLRAKAA